jgi:hypothetical protein
VKLPKELRDKKDLGDSTKQRECSIKGCSETAVRSLSENSWKKFIEKAGLKYNPNLRHKIFLCKIHYNQSSKHKKSQEKMLQKKGFLDNSNAAKKGKWDI